MRGTSISSHWAAVRQADVQGGVQRSVDQHHDVTRRPHQDATAASVGRHPGHMAHCTVIIIIIIIINIINVA